MASAAERALGRLLSKHRTDSRRRARTALRALALGTAATGGAVVALVAGIPPWAGGVLLAAGLLELWRGAARGWDHRRRGAEVFMIRERGLIHRRTGTVTAVPWQDIDTVTLTGRGETLLRLLGRDVVCRVRLRNGAVLRITAFTHDAGTLAETIAGHAGSRDPVRTLQRTAT
ncbi:hypothetical protein [Streptomyces sp. URMC 129]|uniref:hypothetical protein n=1 Tax=Streptomyces sp. URMC 129 TaxID=3423407 RepID=UPI003F1951E7